MLKKFVWLLFFRIEDISSFIHKIKLDTVENKYDNLTKMLEMKTFYDDISSLSADIIGKIRSTHCLALITDRIFQQYIYKHKFFEIINGKSVFMMNIKDTEDFDNEPGEDMKRMLQQMKNNDCDSYLILISNGIQIKSLLRFGDRYRLLNTRAKFIILHDYRLFSKDFQYIWKRIVNVVFMKQYDRHLKATIRSGKWFELSTVPFPLSLKQVFVSKVLDFWMAGRFRFNNKLFEDKSKNLQGEELQVVVLKHTPAVLIEDYGASNATIYYSGIEVEILKMLSIRMNFTFDLHETEDALAEKWGSKDENGSFSGLLGEMDNGKAEFALANLHYTLYHLEVIDLSIPYNTECLTFLTPESSYDNSWKTLILPFSEGMWAGVGVSLILVGVVFFLFSNVYIFLQGRCLKQKKTTKFSFEKLKLWKRTKTKGGIKEQITVAPIVIAMERNKPKELMKDLFDDLSYCILYTYSMILLVSLPRLPYRWSVRWLTGWWLLYSVLVVVAYRASLTAILAMPQPRVTIDRLEVLAKSKTIKCGAWGQQNKDFFINSQDEASRKVGAKIEQIVDAFDAVERVLKGEFAYYENDFTLQEIRFKYQNSPDLQKMLHIMEQCVVNMPISIGLEKNSPLKSNVDVYMRRAIESGLTNKWLVDAIRSFQASVETAPQEALMDLKKFYGALVALGVGYVLGVLALLGEKVYWKYAMKKHPLLYDKYSLGSYYQRIKN